MRSFILSLPAKLQPVVIIGSTVVAAFVVSLVTRACFNAQQLVLDSTWTIAAFGTLGTLYSVLIAFVVTGVWQSFSAAQTAVNSEANTLTDVVFLIRYISPAKTVHVRESAKSYVASVVERWDLLERATRENKPVEEINFASTNALVDAILALKPEGDRELEVYAQALDLTAIWLDARRNRLRSGKGIRLAHFGACSSRELSSCLLCTGYSLPMPRLCGQCCCWASLSLSDCRFI